MADSTITPLAANGAYPFSSIPATINAIINAIATEIVTANNSAAGATTIGNGFVVGIFGATTLVTSNLRGGNSSAANTLPITSNVSVNASSVVTLGNTSINATTVSANNLIGNLVSPAEVGNTFIYDIFVQSAGLSATLLDSFLFTAYRSADYLISISDNNANNKMLSKLLILQDGGSAYSSEFGTVISNSIVGTFTANANTTAVTLFFTPSTSNSCNVRITRTCQNI